MAAYGLIECASLEQAIDVASRHPMARAATIEVRPVWADLARQATPPEGNFMKLYFSDTLNPRKACAVAKYLNLPVKFVGIDLGKGNT